MKNQRINTTLSEKHYAILKKHTKMYGTQRSVLEHALEKSLKTCHDLSQEEEIWMQMYQIKDLYMIHAKDHLKLLFNTAKIDKIQEYIKKDSPVKFIIEWYYNKPFQDFRLSELIGGIIFNIKVFGFAENINLKDSDDHYTMNIFHELGLNGSKIILYMNENVLEEYGAKFESECSIKNVFFKIYK